MAGLELIELIAVEGGYELAGDRPAELRVGKGLWERYLLANGRLVAAVDTIEKAAVRPVYVTPEQEAAVRAIAKPDAWIVVRDAEAAHDDYVHVEAPVSSGPVLPDVANEAPQETTPAPSEPEKPKRPPIGRCEQRGGLPHAVLRYVLTETPSEFFPGRTRIDGLCQCGERIPDVTCPHQKQEPDALKRPRCAWCKKLIVGSVGVIDNRKPQGYGGGSPDPNVRTPVPINAGKGDSFPEAYRAPE